MPAAVEMSQGPGERQGRDPGHGADNGSGASNGSATAATVDRRRRGAVVEAAARRYLLTAGLREVATNANYRVGELDLVMLDDGRGDDDRGDAGLLDESRRGDARLDRRRKAATLVFVEVRYRRDARFGGGAASVDVGKRRKLVRAAQLFLAGHRQFADIACRFDVIEADGSPDAPRLNWLRDAFRADDC